MRRWAAALLYLAALVLMVRLMGRPSPPMAVQAASPSPSPTLTPVLVAPAPAPSPHAAHWIVGTIPGVDAADLEDTLMRIRGLRFRRRVPAATQSREELRRYLSHDPDAEPAEQEWASLRVFGFIPPAFDVTRFKLDLLTQQVGGYYDPQTARFNVVAGNNGLTWFTNGLASLIGYDPTSIVTIHEMDHALTDQYFNIRSLEKAMVGFHDDDHALAVQGLIEGDATWIMMDYALQRMPMGVSLDDMPDEQMQFTMQQASDSALDALKTLNGQPVPLVFERMLVFPYFAGMRFIHHLYRLGGWEVVNRAWHDPPESTQQLMHPERYSGARAFPLHMSWPGPPRPVGAWQPLLENTVGEFLLTVFFEQHLHASVDDITDHWDGDRYRVYHHGRQLYLTWMTAWDTPVAAQRFLRAVTQVLGPHGSVPDRLPGSFRAERRGTRVGVLYGVPSEQAMARWSELWTVQARRHPHPVTVHFDSHWVANSSDPTSLSHMFGSLFGSGRPTADFQRRGGSWVSPSLHLALDLPADWTVTTHGLSGNALLRGDSAQPGLMAFLIYSVPSPRLGFTLDIATQVFLDHGQRLDLHPDTSHGIPLRVADYQGWAPEWQQPSHLRWVVMDRRGQSLILGMAWTQRRQTEAASVVARITHSLRYSPSTW